MKKLFENPEIEVLKMSVADVITTSEPRPDDDYVGDEDIFEL